MLEFSATYPDATTGEMEALAARVEAKVGLVATATVQGKTLTIKSRIKAKSDCEDRRQAARRLRVGVRTQVERLDTAEQNLHPARYFDQLVNRRRRTPTPA